MLTIGLMSGTSMDGIDAVILDTDGEQHIEQRAHASLRYTPEFRHMLKLAEKHICNTVDKLIASYWPLHKTVVASAFDDVSQESTELHCRLVQKLLQDANIAPEDIQAIGYHGQTVCHRPKQRWTLQLGFPQVMANALGIPVVFDFRTNDLVHGGQGAPLAPLYHQALLRQKNLPNVAMINCGGIANISVLMGPQDDDLQAGFDAGPGNVLLDAFVNEWTENQKNMDKDGAYALQGALQEESLRALFESRADYYLRQPPKSLDSSDCLSLLTDIMALFPKGDIASLYNGCATLAALTAYIIAKNMALLPETPTHWILSGGGAKNPAILFYLEKYAREFLPTLPILIQTADEAGFDSLYMEAELIAWLTARHLRNLPLTVPQTTGVFKPVCGGELFMPT